MKELICTTIGIVGAYIVKLVGGWDSAVSTLILFMAIDYATGLIVAGVFKKSGKTKNGALESRAGWKGLCRKCMMILFVCIACRLDLLIGSDYIRDAVIIGFVINETISIMENAGLMGVPLPEPLQNGIEVLTSKQRRK